MNVTDWLALSGWAVFVLAAVDRVFAFGSLRQKLVDLEARGTERHEENKDTLREIRDDVKRINGRVNEHEAVIRILR